MDANMNKAREHLLRAFQSGPFVQFSCRPTAAEFGEKVQIVAVFFGLPNEPLSGLSPLVRCKEHSIEQRLVRQGDVSKYQMTFECELDTNFLNSGSFTLLLYKKSDEEPIASTTLEIFKKREMEQFRDSIRDLPNLR